MVYTLNSRWNHNFCEIHHFPRYIKVEQKIEFDLEILILLGLATVIFVMGVGGRGLTLKNYLTDTLFHHRTFAEPILLYRRKTVTAAMHA